MSALVSIIIPIKNRSQFFEETAQSLVQETHREWEALVVDDDSAVAEFKRIAAIAGGDPRFRLMTKSVRRHGAPARRNEGLAASKGDYVIFLDADDLLAPDCLERRVKRLEENPQADFVVFQTGLFREKPGDTNLVWDEFNDEDDLERFLRGDAPWCCYGPIWRRSSLSRIGPWDERALSWQDWEFHIRAVALGLRYVKVPEPDSYYRLTRPGSISFKANMPRQIFNRARLFGRVAIFLREQDALNRRRRRILAAQFLRHAFYSGLRRKEALQIWRVGLRAKVIRWPEFTAGLAFQGIPRVTNRICRGFEHLLFPELNTLVPRG
jgi:glycosyltransferase involved in cell wall biosynthesis